MELIFWQTLNEGPRRCFDRVEDLLHKKFTFLIFSFHQCNLVWTFEPKKKPWEIDNDSDVEKCAEIAIYEQFHIFIWPCHFAAYFSLSLLFFSSTSFYQFFFSSAFDSSLRAKVTVLSYLHIKIASHFSCFLLRSSLSSRWNGTKTRRMREKQIARAQRAVKIWCLWFRVRH